MAPQQTIVLEKPEIPVVLAELPHWGEVAHSPLATLGSLQARLAVTQAEIETAQRLRYRVFIEERGLYLGEQHDCQERADRDDFDAACDHLLIVDTADRHSGENGVVATCRLLPAMRRQAIGFYSEREFDLSIFLQHHQEFNALELGRSCVSQSHRNKRAMETLWRGIWAYIQRNKIGLLFGCASIPSHDRARVHAALRYLNDYAAAPQEWNVGALPHCRTVTTDTPAPQSSPREIFGGLPPLLKAYLRLGARAASEAAEDKEFETTDVFVALRVHDIARRYAEHYSS